MTAPRATCLRPGLWRYRGHDLERLDHAAEVDPADDRFGLWRVYDLESHDPAPWLRHYPTLAAARAAVDQVLDQGAG